MEKSPSKQKGKKERKRASLSRPISFFSFRLDSPGNISQDTFSSVLLIDQDWMGSKCKRKKIRMGD